MPAPLQMGQEYYWKSVGSRWDIYVEPHSYNGLGGYWVYERWRWNGSSYTARENIRTLTLEESAVLEEQVRRNG